MSVPLVALVEDLEPRAQAMPERLGATLLAGARLAEELGREAAEVRQADAAVAAEIAALANRVTAFEGAVESEVQRLQRRATETSQALEGLAADVKTWAGELEADATAGDEALSGLLRQVGRNRRALTQGVEDQRTVVTAGFAALAQARDRLAEARKAVAGELDALSGELGAAGEAVDAAITRTQEGLDRALARALAGGTDLDTRATTAASNLVRDLGQLHQGRLRPAVQARSGEFKTGSERLGRSTVTALQNLRDGVQQHDLVLDRALGDLKVSYAAFETHTKERLPETNTRLGKADKRLIALIKKLGHNPFGPVPDTRSWWEKAWGAVTYQASRFGHWLGNGGMFMVSYTAVTVMATIACPPLGIALSVGALPAAMAVRPGRPAKRQAVAEKSLAELKHARDLAELSMITYNNSADRKTYGDYTRKDIIWSEKQSFRADVWEKSDGSIVIVYRGSHTLDNWGQNVSQGIGLEARQEGSIYREAADLAIQLQEKYQGRHIELTGHSLGGGLSQVASSVTGLQSTTFNAAGPNPLTYDALGTRRENVRNTNYEVEMQPLDKVQDVLGSGVLPIAGALAGGPAGWTVAALGAIATDSQVAGDTFYLEPKDGKGGDIWAIDQLQLHNYGVVTSLDHAIRQKQKQESQATAGAL